MNSVWIFNFFKISLICAGLSEAGDYDTYRNFYKDLGCTKNKDYAAHVFDCPEFPPKNGSCRFSNHYTPAGVKIDQELLKGSCIPECKCKDDGFFTCAGTDCALIAQDGCHMRHSLDSCCPGELICGDAIAKCEVDGKIYKEGEKFTLQDSCEVCVCDKGFKKEAPFCRRQECYLELLRSQEVANFNAPVFLKDDHCCPTTWIVDEGQDDIRTLISDTENLACKFGKKAIKLGDGFNRTISRFGIESKLICECYSPPYVICREL